MDQRHLVIPARIANCGNGRASRAPLMIYMTLYGERLRVCIDSRRTIDYVDDDTNVRKNNRMLINPRDSRYPRITKA